MATKPKKDSLMEELETQISKLIKDTMKSADATLTDKTKVLDRGLKLAQIIAKIDDPSGNAGFSDD
jgi:hypothetical protein